MGKKNIRVEIKSEEESAQEFVKAWRRAEAGEPAEAPSADDGGNACRAERERG